MPKQVGTDKGKIQFCVVKCTFFVVLRLSSRFAVVMGRKSSKLSEVICVNHGR